MLRFTYTDITKKALSCNDCEKSCKSNILTSTCMNAHIKFVYFPKVSNFPSDDFRQLRKQIMMSKCNALSLKDEICRDVSNFPYDCPSIGECQIFIGVMDIFRDYILENKDIYKRNPDLAIQTVLVVRDNKIISSSKISELNKILSNYANKTGNKFTTDEPVFLEESKNGNKNKYMDCY